MMGVFNIESKHVYPLSLITGIIYTKIARSDKMYAKNWKLIGYAYSPKYAE